MATIYDYYKDAAERHLETCKELREFIKTNYQGSSTLSKEEEKKQKMILANIYYLSGYVIECIVNFGILKHIKFETTGKKSVDKLTFLDSKHKVSYSREDKFSEYSLWEKDHKLNAGNNKLLYFKQKIKIAGGEIDKIPLINGLPMGGIQKKLIDNWGARIRYDVDNNLLIQSEILNFQTTSLQVYEGLVKHIIPKL
jgi:hypothetical protein